MLWGKGLINSGKAAEAMQRGEARAPTELRDEDEYEEGDHDLPI